ncbi:MAG: response regulator [Alphaproteobacteria bacterium]|nr:response regulator [Alphaproteobacteria bacterium]
MALKTILSQMADYTTDAIIITKSTQENRTIGPEIVYVNRGFTNLTGYEADEVIGKTPRFLQGPKTDKKTLARIAHAIENQSTICAEILNYSKEGYEYWVEINLNPILDPESGDCVYFLVTERDITERKTAESQLLRAIKNAEAATKAKSEFLANMSHELRTPMNGILGLAEILQGTEITQDVRECVDAIHSSGMSLLTILNDILDLSKIEAQELEIEHYAFKTRDILKNIHGLTMPIAQKKSLLLDMHMNFNVPEWLCGDGKRIQQIIFNLVGNAIKFTETGSVTLSVDYRAVPSGSVLMIQVQDTGIGIPDEFHKNLFNKFSQADTSISRKFGGTGLGLAITKNLVEMMGGQIGFTSKVNFGTTFYLSIPIIEAPQQDILQTEIKANNEDALEGVDLKIIKALVVEDHPINQMLVVKWLKKLGLKHIDSALNGFESISLLRKNTYDFILMDCQMPELDGYETTSLIRDMEKQLNSRTPIIAMTANAMLGEREKCLAAGMDDYLSKPLNYTQFKSCIAQWIGAANNSHTHATEEGNSSSLTGHDGNTTSPGPTAQQMLDDSVPVDLSRLQEFTEGDKDTEQMVINLFLETAYISFDMLKTAQMEDNAQEWSKAAHSFKGASGNLGAMLLHRLCSEAEHQGECDRDQKDLILSGIYAEFNKVETYLKGLN